MSNERAPDKLAVTFEPFSITWYGATVYVRPVTLEFAKADLERLRAGTHKFSLLYEYWPSDYKEEDFPWYHVFSIWPNREEGYSFFLTIRLPFQFGFQISKNTPSKQRLKELRLPLP